MMMKMRIMMVILMIMMAILMIMMVKKKHTNQHEFKIEDEQQKMISGAHGGEQKKSCSSQIHLFPSTSIIIDYFTPSSFPRVCKG